VAEAADVGAGELKMGGLPPWARFALGDGKKKKKPIVRIPDEFYFQYFTPPHVYSYFKVRSVVHVQN